MLKIVFLFLFFLIFSFPLLTQTAVISIGPSADLHAAISSLNPGDTLSLSAGTFRVSQESLLADAGPLTLQGQGPSATTIAFLPSAGAPYSRFLQLSGSTALTLAGLTVRDFLLDPSTEVSVLPGASGGAVVWLRGGSLTVSQCVLLNNSASLQFGGAILSSAPDARVSLLDSSFLANSAAAGSVLAIDGAQSPSSSGSTSGSSSSRPIISLKNCQLANNVAKRAAVVSSLFSFPLVSISGSRFEANNGLDGGGIRAWSGDFSISGSSFVGHVSSTGSACRFEYATTAVIADSLFANNTAFSSAGGIRFLNTGPNHVLRATFLSNVGGEAGGAVDVDGGPTHVRDSYFAYNQSPFGGGLIYLNYGCSGSTVANCTFFSNAGDIDGGAVRIRETQAVSLSACTFRGNFGGALALENSATATLADSALELNRGEQGGAISLSSGARLSLAGAFACRANSAALLGGCLYLTGNASLVALPDASLDLSANEAPRGGALAVSGLGSFSLEGPGAVAGNAATFGGAFFLSAASFAACPYLSPSLSIVSNTAQRAGGAFFVDTTDPQLSNACPHLFNLTSLTSSSSSIPSSSIPSSLSSSSSSLSSSTDLANNHASYGGWIGGPPASMQWDSPFPSATRIDQPLSLRGTVVDVFSQPVLGATTFYAFQFALASSAEGLSIGGRLYAVPRVDGHLDYFLYVRTSSALRRRLPMPLALSFTSSPPGLSQRYALSLLPCSDAYVPHRVGDEDVCLLLIDASQGARAAAGVVASLGLLLLAVFLLHLLLRGPLMVHLLRRADRAHLLACLLGAALLLLSLYPWLQDTPANCVARPWLAALGFAALYAALSSLSFTNAALSRRVRLGRALLLTLSLAYLAVNVAVLAAWTALDPYTLVQDIDLAAYTTTQYCASDSVVYIWLLVGFDALLILLATLGVFVLSSYPFQYRQSKHFTYALVISLATFCTIVPVAATNFSSLDAFFLLVTMGLAAVALLPLLPLLGLRLYRVYVPMEGLVLDKRIDFLTADIVHRKDMIDHFPSTTETASKMQQPKTTASSITAGFPSTEIYSNQTENF